MSPAHNALSPGSTQVDETTIAAFRRAFPAAWGEVSDELVAEMDNTRGDRHVFATAVAAGHRSW